MPILGAYPVLDQPPAEQDLSLVETRTLAFRTLDGADLMPWTGREFAGRNGMTGLDLPPVEVIETEEYGDEGSRITEMRFRPRDIFVPLYLRSDSSHLDYLRDKRARLIDLFDFALADYQVNNGTFDIVANSLDANNERTLRCHYQGGLEGNLDRKTDYRRWAALGLKLRAVKPLWQGEVWSTPRISRPAGADWFGTFPPELSPSLTLGSDITVTVPGNAKGWPQITMMGPSPSVEIYGPGLYVRIPEGLADGELAVIDTQFGARRALFNGVDDWARVAPQRQFGRIAPGDNAFNLNLGSAGAGAYAYVSGRAQWKTPW